MLSDTQIAGSNFITPFDAGDRKPGVISYGLTSYGYDFRLGYKFKVFKGYPCNTIDPKAFDENCMEIVDLTPDEHDFGYAAGYCLRCGVRTQQCKEALRSPCGERPTYIDIPPHAFVLAETVEHVTIPRDVLCILVGKSTYARCGLVVNCTPLEPEWYGVITLELSNTTSLPLRVYCNEGIAQGVFHTATGECARSYADKRGKYQNQTGLTSPKV